MGFLPDRSSGPPLLRALARWLVLEVCEGWRTWLPGSVRVGPVV